MEPTIHFCISDSERIMSCDHRNSKIVLIVLFLGMIWLPLVLSILGTGRQSEISFLNTEQRSPQNYPSTPRTITELSSYPNAFEKAFNDRFPLREQSIQLYGKLCILGLHTTPNSQLLLGKNGHCFFGSHFDDRKYAAALAPIQIHEEKIPQEVAQVETYGEFLKSLPVPSVMISIPTSHVLDFENLPEFIQRQADPEAIEAPQSLRVMQSVSKPVRERFMLCPYARIRQANAQYPLYAEKNFHWHTGRYTRLMASCIAEHFGIEQYEEPKSEEFQYESTTSDLNQFASYEMISHNTEVYRPEVWNQLGIVDQTASDVYPKLPPLNHTRYTVNPKREHCILVVGESFTPMLNPDLARYFGEVISVNYNVARQNPEVRKWLEVVMGDVRPDYVVFLHHQIFYIFDDFMTDYRAIQGTDQSVQQISSDPKTPRSNH